MLIASRERYVSNIYISRASGYLCLSIFIWLIKRLANAVWYCAPTWKLIPWPPESQNAKETGQGNCS
ncbi:hypothetical protein DFAR_630070 [Desulfarculales bacterium]